MSEPREGRGFLTALDRITAVNKQARAAARDEDEQRAVADILKQYMIGEGDAAESHVYEIAEEVLDALGRRPPAGRPCFCGHSLLWHRCDSATGVVGRCEAEPDCRCREFRPEVERPDERVTNAMVEATARAIYTHYMETRASFFTEFADDQEQWEAEAKAALDAAFAVKDGSPSDV